jgi:predicted small secreted protein
MTIPLRYLSGGLAQIVLLQKRYPRRLETEMHQLIFAIFILILLGMTAACNTVHGLGRDVERVGEETQDAANAAKRRL